LGKVLIEFEKINNTTEVNNAYFTAVLLQCKGIDFKIKKVKEITSDDLNWCDIYLAIRPLSIYSLEVAKKVKEVGAFYITFFDDDLLNKDANPSRNWKANYAKSCLKYADIVIGANPVLVEEYAQLTKTKRYAVLNSAVLEEDILPIDEVGSKIKMVYAAGRDHAHFFDEYIKPVINRFLQEYHEKVSITFVGVEPELTGIEHRECFHFIPQMPYDKYNQFMRENRFDIGIAPLSDSKFENRKYYNKFIEYTKIGTLGLYSNCLPYTLVVQDNVNGFLVNNDSDSWLIALQNCVRDIEYAKKCVENAQRLLRNEFTVSASVKVLQTLIPEIESYKKSNEQAFKIHKSLIGHVYFQVRDICNKLSYHLKKDGFSKTIGLIKKHSDTYRR